MEMHRTKSSQRYFEEENKAWECKLLDIKMYYKTKELKQCDTDTCIDKLTIGSEKRTEK